MGLEARIWASRLGFGPRDWDLGLETGIWASRLGFEGGGMKEKEKKKEEKIPHMCERIGHRPPRGPLPKKADFRPDSSDLWPEGANYEMKKADLIGLILSLRGMI